MAPQPIDGPKQQYELRGKKPRHPRSFPWGILYGLPFAGAIRR